MLCALLLAMAAAGQQSPPLPPPESPPLVRVIEIRFPSQGNVSLIEPETYLYYIRTRPSRPSAGVWVPYDRQTAIDDFQRLWATGFLDDLSVEAIDEPYANGVVGKHLIFNLEERLRVKTVDFEGTRVLEPSKIDAALKEANATIRLDTFVDAALVRRCERVVANLLLEKGYQLARVTHTMRPIGDNRKLVHLTFHVDAGPQVRIRSVAFVGNRVFSDGVLARQMKTNRPPQRWLPSFLRRASAYQAAKYEDDADLVVQYCRDRGYVTAHVGEPRLKAIGRSRDRRTRWVELLVPITEGERYRVGTFAVQGSSVVKTKALRDLFRVREGEFYQEQAVRKGLEKAREVYGAGGYFEFTGYPDLKPRDQQASGDPPRKTRRPPILDVTMRLQEGKQYFVNRVFFKGNTVTRDSVIRREMMLAEAAVFDTEALKYSVRRLNQLGYFKPLEDGKNIQVEKTPGADNKVDITLNLEEQNRNQIQFGAGVSEYDGVYGSASYTAANFLGRGESVTVALQRGFRSNLYQVGVAEPYLFDRPISGGIDLYSRKYNYLVSEKVVGYSEVREGASFSLGRPLMRFSRANLNYTYEVIDTSVSPDLLGGSRTDVGVPLFNSYYDVGRHIDSRITPAFVHNTVDNPVVPHSGMRLTGSVQLASRLLGGSYGYTKPEAEAILYLPTSRRTGFGLRAEAGWLHTYGGSAQLPYYLRYFLGGEYQIRGVDIRTVGPLDSSNRSLGGNKYVLFNAEYYLDIAAPVRAVLFHDAGQAFAENEPVNLLQLRTSTGAELRIVVPMLNVPFRLIWARNIYRDAFQPAQAFKFAVGTTF